MISVLLPAYNAEKYICRAVESILSQTYKDFELIIIDDGSIDKTPELIRSQFDDSRIKHTTLKTNIGIVGALNVAISMAKGQYLARMDADDVCMPNRFLQQIKFLEANPEYAACGTSLTIKDEGGHTYNVNYPNTHSEIMASLNLFHRNISHPSVMMRSKIVKENKIRYSQGYPHAEDYMLWKKLSDYGKLYNLKENLLLYNYHEDQVSSKHYNTQLVTSRKILEIFLKDFFEKGQLKFSKNVYINFLVQKHNDKTLTLSPEESRGALKDLRNYVSQNPDIDTRYATKILLYKSCLASVFYNHSSYDKLKVFLYSLCSSPYLMLQLIVENHRHFYFKIKKRVDELMLSERKS